MTIEALPLPRRRAPGLVLGVAVLMSVAVGASMVLVGPVPIGIAVVLPLLVAATFIDARILLYAIIVAMLLSPEVVVGSTASRPLTLRSEDLMIPLAMLAILARRVLQADAGLRMHPLILPMAAVSIGRILSTGLAAHEGLVIPGTAWLYVLKTIEYFLLFYLGLNGPRTLRDSDRMLVAMFATAIATALLASAGIGSGDRLSAPFEGEKAEPNTLGGYLAFVIATLSGFALSHPRPLIRRAATASAVFLSVPMLFTLSRASYLAAAAIGAVLVVLKRRISLALGLVAAVFAIGALGPDVVRERVASTAQVEEGPFEHQIKLEGSAASKLGVWTWFKVTYATRPFLGWGVTGAGLVDAEYPRVFAEGGLIGLGAFLWLQFAIFGLARRGLRADDVGTRCLATGFLAGWVGLLFHAVGANTFLLVRVMEPFWFMAGLLAFRLHRHGETAAEGEPG